MTRGFITIATGKKHYYELAANLLKSYRFFCSSPLPFAIIAEEENEYTKLFDDVIITNESTHSFCDKFLLLRLCPYDETIFFDADSLAYGDLNQWWNEFVNATDFSAPGANIYPPYSKGDGSWYMIEDIGEYGKSLEYKCRMHAGVIFIRRGGGDVEKMYNDCMELYQNFAQLEFHTCPKSIDECVFGVAMPMNHMKAITEKPELLGAYPCLSRLSADMLHGTLRFTTFWGTSTECGTLLHWGTIQTYQPLYRHNIACLEYLMKKRETLGGYLLYDKKIWYYTETFRYSVEQFLKRVKNKTKLLIEESLRGEK